MKTAVAGKGGKNRFQILSPKLFAKIFGEPVNALKTASLW
jgi:hypothetical protein